MRKNKTNGIKLHIGCGLRILKGYINIDKIAILPEVIYGDILELKFGENTVGEIYASHVLDHLSRNEELDRALSECYRVLKPEGILRVAVSDFQKVAELYNEGLDLERLWGHIIGGHKSPYDKHGCVFDFPTIRKYLEKHGFKNIQRYRWQDFLPKDFDDLSQCYIPHMDKENGILMSLNVEATK